MSRLVRQASSGLVTQVRSLRWAIVQGMGAYHPHPRVLHGAWVRLERSAVKVARCVLRGLGEGDLAWLPGCAEHVQQFGGASPLPNLMEVKG
jgi:hypothetical protein